MNFQGELETILGIDHDQKVGMFTQEDAKNIKDKFLKPSLVNFIKSSK